MQDSASDRPTARGALVVGLVLAAGLLMAWWGLEPPSVRGADSPAGEFSAERAVAALREVLGEGVPHPAGSEANVVVRRRIADRFAALGLTIDIDESYVCGSLFPVCAPIGNVLAVVPGARELPPVLLVAHHDSVGAGPGAADDGAGVAVLLEVARALHADPPPLRPVWLLVTDAEEDGLLGAEHFARELTPGSVLAVLNLEARGTRGPSLMFETGWDNAGLVSSFARAARRPVASSMFVEVYRRMPNDTDLSAFIGRGLPGLNFAFNRGWSRYHTPRDDLDHLDPRSVQHHGDTTLALARGLAATEALDGAGDLAFTDVFGLVLVRWPLGWTTPLAVLGLLLVIGAAAVLRREGRTETAGVAAGWVAWLLALALGVGLALATAAAISALAGAPTPWRTFPLPMRLAVWAAVALGAHLGAWVMQRWTRPVGLVAGAWLGWAMLALAVAVLAPGAAAVILVPVLAVVPLLLAAGLVRTSGAATAAAVAAGVAAGALTGWPLALIGEDGLGFALGGATMIAICLLMPLTSLAALTGSSRRRGRFAALLAAVVAVAAALALAVPPAGFHAPRQLNLVHVEDASLGVARVVAAPGRGEQPWVPPSLREMADFALVESPPGSQWSLAAPRGLGAATGSLGLAPPRLEDVVVESRSDGGRTVRARLAAGDLPDVMLRLPDPVAEIRVEGSRLGGSHPRRSPKVRWAQLIAVPPAGLVIELDLEDAGDAELILVGRGSGLPAPLASLGAARGPAVVPFGDGDRTTVFTVVDLS